MSCENCKERRAMIVRPKNRMKVCKECFFDFFETEIHDLIVSTKMFEGIKKIGIGISGGKDSTVLAYVLDKLNKKYNYGLELVLLCVDEGISGYRDRSIETVHENQRTLDLQLKIVSYEELYGVTMDDIVKKIGKKGNCTYCGILRRQSLEEAARATGVNCIITGHNADDMAETVLLNLFRGDISRLKRCTMSKTKEQVIVSDSNDKICECCSQNSSLENNSNCCEKDKEEANLKYLSLSRCKPFKLTYQKEIVFYAYYKKLPYFSTECTYAPNASRGDFRTLIKDLEKIDPSVILKIIKSGEHFLDDSPTTIKIRRCLKCNHPTSSEDQICNACGLLDKLKNMKLVGCAMNNQL